VRQSRSSKEDGVRTMDSCNRVAVVWRSRGSRGRPVAIGVFFVSARFVSHEARYLSPVMRSATPTKVVVKLPPSGLLAPYFRSQWFSAVLTSAKKVIARIDWENKARSWLYRCNNCFNFASSPRPQIRHQSKESTPHVSRANLPAIALAQLAILGICVFQFKSVIFPE